MSGANTFAQYWEEQMSDYDIPNYMREGLAIYIIKGIEPGHFLSAVLCNDLMASYGRADSTNERCVRNYCMFLSNVAPGGSYGSTANFVAWIKQGGMRGYDVNS